MLAKGSQNWKKPVAKNSQIKRLSFSIPWTDKIIWLQVRKEGGQGRINFPGGKSLWAVPYQPNSGPPQNASKGPFKVSYKKKLCKATC